LIRYINNKVKYKYMPIPIKTKENSPGITDAHLAMLAKQREQWNRDYALVKSVREDTRVKKFYEKFPYWDKVKSQLPDRYRAVIEAYYGLGTTRLTTTQIGEEMPVNGKPITRQAVHLILKQALAALSGLNPDRLD
jgi:DNA-directed RNA polymerase sigma subunit (sigma70/sigma32)